MKFFGKICPKHPALNGARYARFRNGGRVTGSCVGCNLEQAKEWRGAHKEQVREILRNWNINNPEKVKEKSKRRYERHKERFALKNKEWRNKNAAALSEKQKEKRRRNPEIYKAKMKRWYSTNSHKVMATNGIRRAIARQATPQWANMFFISEIYDLARLRSKVTGMKWSVDHIVPLKSKTVCGLHTEANMRVIPAMANLSKNNRTWPDMPEVNYG